MTVGYPGGVALLAPWPEAPLIRRSYVEQLVLGSCRESAAGPFLTMRAYRAFGVDPNERIRPWERTEDDLRTAATPDEAAFLQTLATIDDTTLFSLLAAARHTPAMCDWDLPQWTTELA